MPGFGQSLAYVIDRSILTMSFGPKLAFVSPLAKLSESAARATVGTKTATQTAASTQTIRIQRLRPPSALPTLSTS